MSILNIPLIKQNKRMCGPACLQMVLKYYGINKSETQLKKMLGATYFCGTRPEEIVKTAKKLGLKAKYCKNNSIKELKKTINNKIPPIIGWFSPTSGSHFSVVVGFKKDNILIADPEIGKIIKMNLKDFSSRWLDINWSKFSNISQLYFDTIMRFHNKIRKSKKIYKPPIKQSKLIFRETIIIKK